jgi:IclR family mhp operon transcriptional activator
VVTALLRGIDILRLLNVESGLTASDVGRRIGLARITAYRLLRTLEHGGYVVHDETRRYRLGPGVLELSSLYAKQNWVIEIAAPIMRETGARLGWPLVLGASNGPRMTILHSTRDETGFWLRMRGPGSQMPILRSAMGLVFLAYTREDVRKSVLRAALALDGGYTPEWRDQPERIEKTLEEIRRRGASGVLDSWHSDSVAMSAIAVPIYRRRTVFAALALTYFKSAMSTAEALDEYVESLRVAAQQIGRSL